MMRSGNAAIPAQISIAACVCGVSFAAPPATDPAPEPPPFLIVDEFDPLSLSLPSRRDVLSTLRPVVKRFGFDDALTGPNALPPDFFRYVAPSQGYPPFGEMRVVSGAGYVAPADAHPGDAAAGSALQFDLLGGSMSARVGPAVIPVLPFADYIVGCRVRTEGLEHAQARLVAWLCDSAGRMIAASRVESRPAEANGRWDTLALEVHGDFADAADLVFELQLAQPRRAPEQALLDPDPQMQDVRGRAWFDDVVISHMPRVQLELKGSQQLLVQGEPISFQVSVKELASERLSARLRVFDIDAALRCDRSFTAPRGRDASEVEITLDRCGWYRAVLDVASDQGVARRRWLDLLVLPPEARRGAGHGPFGVTLHDATMAQSAQIATQLGCGLVVAPAWDVNTTLVNLPRIAAARRETIERLIRSNIDVALAMNGVPDELGRAAGGGMGRTALDALCGDPQRWRPYLDDLLTHFGMSIDRWIVGDQHDVDSQPEQMAENARNATAALAAYVPGPAVHLAWPIEQQPLGDSGAVGVSLHAPATIQPAALGDYLTPWLADTDRSSMVTLDLLPADRYSPRQRVIDTALRGLNAWRAGSPATLIAQPWSVRGAGGSSPDVVASAWHALNEQLAGRRFVSELPLGPDVHVWAVAGRDSSDAALIAWCDRASSASQSTHVDLQLADHALEVRDIFGNRSTSQPRDGVHRLELGEMPVFVQGVSLELVLFRSGVSIEPSFIPAASKVHEHEVVIRNPWDVAVAGTLRLASDADLQISPSVQEFAIAANGEARLPIQIVPQRGILAGQRALNAEIAINADQLHVLRTELLVDVGLKDIEVNVAWSISRNPTTGRDDLLISPAVTNRSDRPVNLDIDLLAAGVSQMRRTIAALGPGQTQTRTFRIAGGAAALAGQSVRLGVAQRDGVARLNKIVNIDAAPGKPQLTTAAPDR